MLFLKKNAKSHQGKVKKTLSKDSGARPSQSKTRPVPEQTETIEPGRIVNKNDSLNDLVRLVSERRFAAVERIISQFDPEAFKIEHREKIRPAIAARRKQPTLLHYACTLRPPLSTVRLLTDRLDDDSNNESSVLSTTNVKGWCPLHVACRHNASSEVVQYLVTKCPTSATSVDGALRTPLHLAVGNSTINPSVVEILVTTCPSIVEMEDSVGNTALEQALLEGKVGMRCLNMVNKVVKKVERNDISLSKLIPAQ